MSWKRISELEYLLRYLFSKRRWRNLGKLNISQDICHVICRQEGPFSEKLQARPEAAGRGQSCQDLGHSFSLYELTLSWHFFNFFFPTVNWQVTPILDKQRCISNYYFMLVTSSSPIEFSKVFCRSEISCKIWSCTTKTPFSRWESLKIKLFYRKWSGRRRENSLCVFHKNFSNDQRGNIDCYWLISIQNFTARETQDNAPLQLQRISHNFKTLKFSYSGFPCHCNRDKVTLINRRCKCKKVKDWRLPLTFRSEM